MAELKNATGRMKSGVFSKGINGVLLGRKKRVVIVLRFLIICQQCYSNYNWGNHLT